MIVFGSVHALEGIAPIRALGGVYNINSPAPYGINISRILPCNVPLGIYPEGYDYDVYLANYICNDNIAFSCFMSLIYSDYIGEMVYVLIDRSEWSMVYIESLMKFIQARYGFTPNLINEPEDLATCKPTEYSIEGRQQLQADKERYVYIHYNEFMSSVKDEDDE